MAKRKSIPSVQSGIPRLGECPNGWRSVKFGDVLKEVSRPAKLENDREYQLVVAKRSRGGIAPRERLPGSKILTKTQFYIESGDFLISKRQIVHGACGIVPESLSGAIVSNEYTVLHPTDELDLQYLWYLAHTIYFQQTCFHSSVGVDIEKMIFRLSKWLSYEFHLPPLKEQRKIAHILLTWDRAIELVNVNLDALRLRRRYLLDKVFFENSSQDFERTELEFSTIAELRLEKADPNKIDPETPCIELEHISSGDGILLGNSDAASVQSLKTKFFKGDVLFGKLRPYLRKFYSPSFDGICSSEIWVLNSISEFCPNRILYYLVQSKMFMEATNRTTGTKMPRAVFTDLSKFKFSIPTSQHHDLVDQILQHCERQIIGNIELARHFTNQRQSLLRRLLNGSVRGET